MTRGALKVSIWSVAVLLLGGLFVAAVLRWREQANRHRCEYHLQQHAAAVWHHVNEQNSFGLLGGPNPDARPLPLGTVPNPALAPADRLGLHVPQLRYIGKADLYAQFDLKKGWDADPNRDRAATLVPLLVCPSLYDPPPPGAPVPTAYVGVAGVGADAPMLPPPDPRAGAFRYDTPTFVFMFKDGLSHTILFLETGRDMGPWSAGGPASVRGVPPDQAPFLGRGRPFGGAHSGGANAAFADGSVRFLADSIAPHVFLSQATLHDVEE